MSHGHILHAGVMLTILANIPAIAATRTAEKDFRVTSPARITAGNGIYSIHVENDPAVASCGTWTATTGSAHPAGAGLNVLYGRGAPGIPGTSNTILRSYTSGNYYATGDKWTRLCATVAPETTPVMNGSTVAGYRLQWTFSDGAAPAPRLQFEQEVVVVGPVDGTETVENTVIRETHTLRNLGPVPVAFGLRKHWDWQIAGDDGPYFGSCATPTVACDASMNLTGDGRLSGPYPRTYVINQDPAVTACPSAVRPAGGNCGGSPPYLIAGTVAPPSALSPPPSAPELLQFNGWGSLSESNWQPDLVNRAVCGDQAVDDTSVAYFYGLTRETAIELASGQERSFTQYVAASQDGCPDIIATPPPSVDPCCPPWNPAALESMLYYQGSGSISAPYTLTFQPTVAFLAQIQAYLDYVHSLNAAVMNINIHFRLSDAGTGAAPSGSGPQVGQDYFVSWKAGGGGNPSPAVDFFKLPGNAMQINRWYRVHTGIFLDSGHVFFPASCADNDVHVRVQVQSTAAQAGETHVLQFRRGDGRIVDKRPAGPPRR